MEPVESKDTNPKDAIGVHKLPVGLVPSTGINLASLAFLEGALKYGRYNWRISGVKASIYYDALQRHLEKYWNGEDADAVTRVPHLASAIACLMILHDAKVCNKLIDDRPPYAGIADQIGDLEGAAKHLRDLLYSSGVRQYTIHDTEPSPQPIPTKVAEWPTASGSSDPAIKLSTFAPSPLLPQGFNTEPYRSGTMRKDGK